MKILVIGSGSREHALAWKFAQSGETERIFVAPGNGGTAWEDKCVNVSLAAPDPASAGGQEELAGFARRENVGLTVVGPEVPLAAGIVDCFRGAGLGIIGPDKKAARLEASKAYSKTFMGKYGVRAAQSKNYTEPDAAFAYAREHFSAASAPPLVIKADGLAAGKGVVIAGDLAEAEETLAAFMKNKTLGEAGASVVLEEFLEGKEVSVLAAVSVMAGNGVIAPFISARDHKSRFEGGKGPNTGGMGAIAPAPDFSAGAQDDFIKNILQPTLAGMKAEGMDYRGFIFFGLMVQNETCRLLEYNVRLGDPETQAVLPLMDFDLTGLCAAVLERRLEDFPLKWKKGAVCAPAAVASGYPGSYRKGDAITINKAAFEKTGAKIFIGGAAESAKQAAPAAPGGAVPDPRETGLVTSGGRVLTVSAFGSDADSARAAAYRGLEAITFEGMGYRQDIGGV